MLTSRARARFSNHDVYFMGSSSIRRTTTRGGTNNIVWLTRALQCCKINDAVSFAAVEWSTMPRDQQPCGEYAVARGETTMLFNRR
ncbi:unnamed protein product [Linum trigynum]|uniref:Uncharacterized protein n=1 Tax=Linum trigynum TaxID=586398 RepID=A0AAV2EXH0_9ROSI